MVEGKSVIYSSEILFLIFITVLLKVHSDSSIPMLNFSQVCGPKSWFYINF